MNISLESSYDWFTCKLLMPCLCGTTAYIYGTTYLCGVTTYLYGIITYLYGTTAYLDGAIAYLYTVILLSSARHAATIFR